MFLDLWSASRWLLIILAPKINLNIRISFHDNTVLLFCDSYCRMGSIVWLWQKYSYLLKWCLEKFIALIGLTFSLIFAVLPFGLWNIKNYAIIWLLKLPYFFILNLKTAFVWASDAYSDFIFATFVRLLKLFIRKIKRVLTGPWKNKMRATSVSGTGCEPCSLIWVIFDGSKGKSVDFSNLFLKFYGEKVEEKWNLWETKHCNRKYSIFAASRKKQLFKYDQILLKVMLNLRIIRINFLTISKSCKT